ncbi:MULTISPECIES: hypothetical protein [unclassified Coleofasciculus]|uniref:hypothetical protein n=1 Tax=unclassified Coleofasciculus TaxID=2692782 RepID=UPI0018824E6E|nr:MULTISPECIES: hypothetical protein [unclassified Coleofasciculus]MBE9124718.1 hypothetical protein [Coleofasciculus sp. LEGE 07081]MBE9151843.1 hypothetical protein [Coleofasciculus sp. LEGE 07092]
MTAMTQKKRQGRKKKVLPQPSINKYLRTEPLPEQDKNEVGQFIQIGKVPLGRIISTRFHEPIEKDLRQKAEEKNISVGTLVRELVSIALVGEENYRKISGDEI